MSSQLDSKSRAQEVNKAKPKDRVVNSESPTYSDRLSASLYKLAYANERDQEMTSGMMYRPSTGGLLKSLSAVLDCERVHSVLSDEELGIVAEHVRSISEQVTHFNNTQMKHRYDTSYPGGHVPNFDDNQVGHFSPPTSETPTPTVDIFLVGGGHINFAMSFNQEILKKYGVTNKPEGVYEATMGYVKPLEGQVLSKLASALKSPELSQHWDELQGKLSYSPKSKLGDIVNTQVL